MRITPTPSASAVVVASRRRRSTHGGRTGSAARRSTSANAAEQHGTGGEHRDAGRGAPRPGLAALEHAEDGQGHAAGQQGGPQVVDVVLAAFHGLVEVAQDQPARRAGRAAR